MKLSSLILLTFVTTLASLAQAQTWLVFVPPERDFRVLFPGEVITHATADGSTAFTSVFEEVSYTIYRLPLRTARITEPQVEFQRRIAGQVGDDVHIRPLSNEDDGDWPRYEFEVRRGVSIHRLVEQGGRYYELQVRGGYEQRMLARQTARDFFSSFHLQGVAFPAIGGSLVQQLETWCQSRTNPFARAFCEYSVCLQPGYEKHPRCSALRLR